MIVFLKELLHLLFCLHSDVDFTEDNLQDKASSNTANKARNGDASENCAFAHQRQQEATEECDSTNPISNVDFILSIIGKDKVVSNQ